MTIKDKDGNKILVDSITWNIACDLGAEMLQLLVDLVDKSDAMKHDNRVAMTNFFRNHREEILAIFIESVAEYTAKLKDQAAAEDTAKLLQERNRVLKS